MLQVLSDMPGFLNLISNNIQLVAVLGICQNALKFMYSRTNVGGKKW